MFTLKHVSNVKVSRWMAWTDWWREGVELKCHNYYWCLMEFLCQKFKFGLYNNASPGFQRLTMVHSWPCLLQYVAGRCLDGGKHSGGLWPATETCSELPLLIKEIYTKVIHIKYKWKTSISTVVKTDVFPQTLLVEDVASTGGLLNHIQTRSPLRRQVERCLVRCGMVGCGCCWQWQGFHGRIMCKDPMNVNMRLIGGPCPVASM